MKKILTLGLGSGISGALNIAALLVISTYYSADSVGQFYLSRDFCEGILKFLFVSQIGTVITGIIARSKIADNVVPGDYYSSACSLTLITMLAVCLLFNGFSEAILSVYMSDIDAETERVVSRLISVMLIYSGLYMLDAILASILIYNQHFRERAAADIVANAVLIALVMADVYAGPATEIQWLPYCLLISQCVRVAPKMLCLHRGGMRWSLKIDLAIAREMAGRLKQYILPNAISQAYRIIYLQTVSSLSLGAFGAYSLVYRSYTAAQGFITVNIVNFYLKELATSAALEERSALSRKLAQVIGVHFASGLVVVLLALLASDWVGRLVYGVQHPELVAVTSQLIVLIAIAFIVDGACYIYQSVTSLLGADRKVARSMNLNILLDMVFVPLLVKQFGVTGLIFSTMVTRTAVLLYLSFAYHVKR